MNVKGFAVVYGWFLLLAMAAQAGSFTGPTAGTYTRYDNDAFPFDERGAHVQEVFPQTAFGVLPSDIVQINAIAVHGVWGTTDVQGLRILMGVQTGEPRLSDFSSSFGTLNGPTVEVFPTANLRIAASSTAAVIPLPKPFVYDRRAGNLFMDLQCATSISSGGGSVDWIYNNDLGPTYYTLEQSFPQSNFPATWVNGALVMDLYFTAVPEPSVLSMGFIGLGFFVMAAKIKRTLQR